MKVPKELRKELKKKLQAEEKEKVESEDGKPTEAILIEEPPEKTVEPEGEVQDTEKADKKQAK